MQRIQLECERELVVGVERPAETQQRPTEIGTGRPETGVDRDGRAQWRLSPGRITPRQPRTSEQGMGVGPLRPALEQRHQPGLRELGARHLQRQCRAFKRSGIIGGLQLEGAVVSRGRSLELIEAAQRAREREVQVGPLGRERECAAQRLLGARQVAHLIKELRLGERRLRGLAAACEPPTHGAQGVVVTTERMVDEPEQALGTRELAIEFDGMLERRAGPFQIAAPEARESEPEPDVGILRVGLERALDLGRGRSRVTAFQVRACGEQAGLEIARVQLQRDAQVTERVVEAPSLDQQSRQTAAQVGIARLVVHGLRQRTDRPFEITRLVAGQRLVERPTAGGRVTATR